MAKTVLAAQAVLDLEPKCWHVHSPKISTAGEEKIAQACLQCLSLFASLCQQWPWEPIQQYQHVSGLPNTHLHIGATCRDLASAQNMSQFFSLSHFTFGKTLSYGAKC